MGNKMTVYLSFLAVLSLLFSGLTLGQDEPISGPTCPGIIPKVTFCLPYISGASHSPNEACCNGIKSVASTVKVKADAVLVCTCLKDKLIGLNYEPSLISSLPQKCSVHINLPAISKNTDCSKVEPPQMNC